MKQIAIAPPGQRKRPMLRRCMTLFAAMLAAAMPLAALAVDCAVDTSGAAIAFGVYDPLSTAPSTGAGTIVVVCYPPNGSNIPVIFSLSAGASGGYFPRRMASGTNRLDYNLYTSAAVNTVFGNGTVGTQTVPGRTSAIGSASFKASAQIFGVIPAQQDAAFGQYSDTIQVTVTF